MSRWIGLFYGASHVDFAEVKGQKDIHSMVRLGPLRNRPSHLVIKCQKCPIAYTYIFLKSLDVIQ